LALTRFRTAKLLCEAHALPPRVSRWFFLSTVRVVLPRLSTLPGADQKDDEGDDDDDDEIVQLATSKAKGASKQLVSGFGRSPDILLYLQYLPISPERKGGNITSSIPATQSQR